MENSIVIHGINGPVVTVLGSTEFSMLEMVYVGNKRLIGEVINLSQKETIIQVYETTTSLRPGEPIVGTGMPICVTLGPGILSNIFDGIQRPLESIRDKCGIFIDAGVDAKPLPEDKLWDVTMTVKAGDRLSGGEVYGTVQETKIIEHRLMLHPELSGVITSVMKSGQYRLNDTVATMRCDNGTEQSLTLCQKWPIRVPRPVRTRLQIDRPIITGQRVIDTLFPIAKGGAAAVPGGFGTGKTMTQHQLAKWSDANIIVYVGCGERGNEMTQVLEEFTELIDPKSGVPLTERTTLIANTSNMPVAAREASIYTGVTIAEYYRDMGYDIALMADSTSRWAEALREISGRLEEMPAEEGFPAYLPSRISQFYERAGYTETLSGGEGSVTLIGAVSPQGGDFSEPVTQNTKRFVRCFLALDKTLAYSRHYPAINWNLSYSEYIPDLGDYYNKNAGRDFLKLRSEMVALLAEENKLMEIVKLIGTDVLPDSEKLVIEMAKIIRVGFLQQNAYHKNDTFVPLKKQVKMMEVISYLYKKAGEAVANSVPMRDIVALPIFKSVIRMKYDVPNDMIQMFEEYFKTIDLEFSGVI